MAEPKWYQELTTYQWRVLICACLGWALDIMDGYLYAIILFPAMSDLLGTTEAAVIGWYGGIVLSIFMIGWALGGLIFGPIADRYGRAKTMAITILIYATFTGLCGIAGSWWELAIFRFLTGLGIGGEWAAGAALIAEASRKNRAPKPPASCKHPAASASFSPPPLSCALDPRLALGICLRRFARHRRLLRASLVGRASALDAIQTDKQSPTPPYSPPGCAATCWSAPASPWSRPSAIKARSNGCPAGLPPCSTPKAPGR